MTSAPRVAELLDFTNRVVVVTGAARGLGAAIASRFSQAGACLVVNYRESREQALALVAALEQAGGKAIGVAADVSVREGVERLLEATVAKLGRVDVWGQQRGGLSAGWAPPHGRHVLALGYGC